ncbi:receptor protein-tyrosine kinase [Rhizomicrobium palustre]|uniref:non-specific protein-tyrosine kinase n=1 Tax=Rhizomicrobium palustre TaxID=189966 RepID=A0A846MTZ7_9PROT|nr:AAA family ATPase [Rhizomicrobium palustre]NIK86705.1 receptor protein-tyrosine kinase [Rhizomicrobium palustre]
MTEARLNLIQRAMREAALKRPPEEGMDRTEPLFEPVLEAAASVREAPPREPPPREPIREELRPAYAQTPDRTVRLAVGRLKEGRMITPDARGTVTYNEFRSIKRKLLPSTRDPATKATTKNIVMITSALAGEGKTYTAMNLAICLAAEKNLDVILVDGDVVRASVSQYFENAPREGLLDLLTGRRQNLDEVLTRCADIPNLHVLFSGSRDETSPELLASQRMADICTQLSRRFRESIVVIDAPPVLATAEPAALAMHVHHLIMVVAAGQVARHHVEEALQGVVACPSISLIFNKAPEWQRATPYSDYYRYGEA